MISRRLHVVLTHRENSVIRVVAQWCNPLTLQSKQSGGVGSIPGRAPTLESHDKGSRNRLALRFYCDPGGGGGT